MLCQPLQKQWQRSSFLYFSALSAESVTVKSGQTLIVKLIFTLHSLFTSYKEPLFREEDSLPTHTLCVIQVKYFYFIELVSEHLKPKSQFLR